ncbi:hypothetical protein C8R45DRAFT_1095878 [Mycena sanguinolenta]|nr:hypothetical protein C8R45DRAFT_1095878 [Mycena sanguinolenta]
MVPSGGCTICGEFVLEWCFQTIFAESGFLDLAKPIMTDNVCFQGWVELDPRRATTLEPAKTHGADSGFFCRQEIGPVPKARRWSGLGCNGPQLSTSLHVRRLATSGSSQRLTDDEEAEADRYMAQLEAAQERLAARDDEATEDDEVADSDQSHRLLTEADLYVGDARPPPLTIEHPHQSCGICLHVKSHPVSYRCGHSHCYVCIRTWCERYLCCPECLATICEPLFWHYSEEQGLAADYPNWKDESRVTYDWSGLNFIADVSHSAHDYRMSYDELFQFHGPLVEGA